LIKKKFAKKRTLFGVQQHFQQKFFARNYHRFFDYTVVLSPNHVLLQKQVLSIALIPTFQLFIKHAKVAHPDYSIGSGAL